MVTDPVLQLTLMQQLPMLSRPVPLYSLVPPVPCVLGTWLPSPLPLPERLCWPLCKECRYLLPSSCRILVLLVLGLCSLIDHIWPLGV